MPAAPRAIVAAAALLLSSRAAALSPPVTIEDDWPGARSEAKRLGVPILADVWAPW